MRAGYVRHIRRESLDEAEIDLAARDLDVDDAADRALVVRIHAWWGRQKQRGGAMPLAVIHAAGVCWSRTSIATPLRV